MGDQDFPEATKEAVKKKAGFQCCRCRNVGIQVHHILPQGEGGSNDIDNAAPLCPNCHDYYGANPVKRKEITQMRDWWYECIERMYPDNRQIGKIEEISFKVDQVIQNQMTVEDFKQVLFAFADEYTYVPLVSETINKMTAGTVIYSASAVIEASASPSASPSPSPSPSPEDY